MSLELLTYLATGIPVAAKFLHTQAKLQTAAEHAIKQNSDLLGRQTTILERVVAIQEQLLVRVEALEEAGEVGVEIVGFRVEEDDEEEEDEEEEEPANRAGFTGRRTSRR